ncbi:MAG: hypothetical protein JWO38_7199 [Gemmataceae bacterium]|nr:hypothetical protein [Gemmataceae bacterium]
MFFPVPPRRDDVPAAEAVPPPPVCESRAEPDSRHDRSTTRGSHPAPTAAAPALTRGAVRLCRLAGTDVFVHWTWFAAAFFLLRDRPVAYSSFAWDVVEYLAGFGLVLLHELGHVLACRRVGGVADRVVLWPLGGLAFVRPPLRPGAALWTTVAGPLVNLALVPVTLGLLALSSLAGDTPGAGDLYTFIYTITILNIFIIVFNLLPIYPLDGGRILREVMWFWVGRAPSLAVAAGLGVVFGAGLVVFAVANQEWWLAALAAFLVIGSVGGVSNARLLSRLRHAPRHDGLACPGCGSAPPAGGYWQCTHCQAAFDLFAPLGACPRGDSHASETSCLECGRHLGSDDWRASAPPTDRPA